MTLGFRFFLALRVLLGRHEAQTKSDLLGRTTQIRFALDLAYSRKSRCPLRAAFSMTHHATFGHELRSPTPRKFVCSKSTRLWPLAHRMFRHRQDKMLCTSHVQSLSLCLTHLPNHRARAAIWWELVNRLPRMCIYIYIYTHTHTLACMYVCMYVCM